MNANGLCRIVLMLTVAALLLTAAGCEQNRPPRPPTTTRPAKTQRGLEYAAALDTANDFCRAWRYGDYKTARAMMTRRFAGQYPDRRLRGAIGTGSGPQHLAAEVWDGKRLEEGRYEFHVRLFHYYGGQMENRLEAPVKKIILLKQNKRWLVDGFPIP